MIALSSNVIASEWWTTPYSHHHKGVRGCGAAYVNKFITDACIIRAEEQKRDPLEIISVISKEATNIKEYFGRKSDFMGIGGPRYCTVQFNYRCKLSNN